MKRFFPLLIGFLLAFPAVGKEEAQKFADAYYRGDHTGYNVTLNLSPDGKYDARWDGCLGQYGAAEGSWEIRGDNLILSPTKETDTMKGHLKVLKIRQSAGHFTLLPEEDDRKMKTEREKQMFSFTKTVDQKQPNQTPEPTAPSGRGSS